MLSLKAITGDETGLLKTVSMKGNKQNIVEVFGGEQTRSLGIVGLNKVANGIYSVLRKNGLVEIWNGDGGSLEMQSCAQSALPDSAGSFLLIDSSGCVTRTVVCFGASGCISFCSLDSEYSINNAPSMDQNDYDEIPPISSESRTSVVGPISAAAACAGGMAFGGNENDVKIYDSETATLAWKAKNVSNDYLSLRVPVWITALHFLRPSGQDSVSGGGAQFITGTGYRQLRVYDTSVGNQPVASFEVGEEHRVTAMCLFRGQGGSSSSSSKIGETDSTGAANLVYVGDTAGGISLWDLRHTKRRVAALKGCAGAIRDMSATSTHFACVGLDRVLHVYNASSNKPVSTVYLKNRLQRCVLLDVDEETHTRVQKGVGQHGGNNNNNQEDSDGGEDENDDDVLEDFEDSGDDSDDEDLDDFDEDEDEDVFSSGGRGTPKGAVTKKSNEGDTDHKGRKDLQLQQDVDGRFVSRKMRKDRGNISASLGNKKSRKS